MFYNIEGVSQRAKTWVSGKDIAEWETQNCSGDGVDIMSMTKLILNERRCAYLPTNKRIAANKWSELQWKQEHTQHELFLKHSVRTNSIRILKAFVHGIRWLFQIKDKSLVLGTHLVETYPNYTRPASELSNNSSYHLDREWLYLSAFNDWRSVELNTVFSRNCQP